ncbi:hypothetical protein NC652_022234 [Populus alba x Populus x berolinensis]|nr:hypothetical protein NC652_022234 [Populus alba x Populus x berolinensis]
MSVQLPVLVRVLVRMRAYGLLA